MRALVAREVVGIAINTAKKAVPENLRASLKNPQIAPTIIKKIAIAQKGETTIKRNSRRKRTTTKKITITKKPAIRQSAPIAKKVPLHKPQPNQKATARLVR